MLSCSESQRSNRLSIIFPDTSRYFLSNGMSGLSSYGLHLTQSIGRDRNLMSHFSKNMKNHWNMNFLEFCEDMFAPVDMPVSALVETSIFKNITLLHSDDPNCRSKHVQIPPPPPPQERQLASVGNVNKTTFWSFYSPPRPPHALLRCVLDCIVIESSIASCCFVFSIACCNAFRYPDILTRFKSSSVWLSMLAIFNPLHLLCAYTFVAIPAERLFLLYTLAVRSTSGKTYFV